MQWWTTNNASAPDSLLLYLPADGVVIGNDTFQVVVDDGISTLPGVPCTVEVQLVPLGSPASPQSRPLLVPSFTAVSYELPCVGVWAECQATLLSLPQHARVSTGGVVITTVPAPVMNRLLTVTPYNDSIAVSVSDALTYVVYDPLQVSGVSTLQLTLLPGLSPPSSGSFTVRTADCGDVLIPFPVYSPLPNNSYAATITSLLHPDVGALLLTDGLRTAVPFAPFVIGVSTAPAVIFSPTNCSAGRTSFGYYVTDLLAGLSSSPAVVTVEVGDASLVATTQPMTVATTQVDPIVITLSASSLTSSPAVVTIAALPLYGTLYQYRRLSSHLFQTSTLLTSTYQSTPTWSTADSPASISSSWTTHAQTLANVSAQIQVSCVAPPFPSCIPPAVLGGLTEVEEGGQVTDPLQRVLYVPSRTSPAVDVFVYGMVGGSSSAVTVDVAVFTSPPHSLPPTAAFPFNNDPALQYLPSLPPWQLPMFTDDAMVITFGAAFAPNTSATSLSFYLSRLPLAGQLYLNNGTSWLPVPPLANGAGNTTVPLKCATLPLLYLPGDGGVGQALGDWAYASFDVFVWDGVLASQPSTVTISVLPPTTMPSCAPFVASTARGTDALLTFAAYVDPTFTIRINTLPTAGVLYQSTVDGLRGAMIVQAGVNVSDPLRKLIYAPYTSSSASTDSFTYAVYNVTTELLSLPCEVLVTVNAAPVAPSVSSFVLTTTEKVAVPFNLSCTPAPCTFTLLTLPGAGQLSTLTTTGNGTNITDVLSTGALAYPTLLFTPNQFEHGDPLYYNYYANFSYAATSVNASTLSSPAVVTVQVAQVNYPPTLANKTIDMVEDGFAVFNLSAVDVDPSLAYTIHISALPLNGTLYQYNGADPSNPIGAPIASSANNYAVQETDTNGQPSSGNRVVYVPVLYAWGTPYANFSYSASFSYDVLGDATTTNASTVVINVAHRNHAPKATAQPLVMTGNDLWIDLSSAATDIDGDEVFYSLVSFPYKGLLFTCAYPTDGGDDDCLDFIAITPSDPSPALNATLNSTGGVDVTALWSYPNVINSSLYLTLNNQAAFSPYLNFSYLAFDRYLYYTLSTLTITLKCAPGTLPNIWMTTGDACTSCPTGAQCSTDGTYAPYAYDGYYAMRSSSGLTFVSCHPSTACLGGYEVGCATGYTGLVCGACAYGYVRLATQCVECPSGLLWLTAVVVGGLVLVGAAVVMALSRHRISFASSYVLLVFLQTLTLYNTYHLEWPNSVSDLFSSASLFSFNVDLFAVSCYIPSTTYAHKWVATVLILPAVLVALTTVYGVIVARGWLRHRLHIDGAGTYHATLTSSVGSLLRYATITLFVTFLPFLAKAFELFNCSTLPDGSRLFNPDSSLLCTDAWWMALYPWAVLCIGLLVCFVGIWVGGGISKHVPRKVEWGEVGWGLRWWRMKGKGEPGVVKDGLKERLIGEGVREKGEGSKVTFSLTSSSSSSVLTSSSTSSLSSAVGRSSSSHRRGGVSDVVDASLAFLTSSFKPLFFYWYLVVLLRLFLLAVTCLLYPDIPIVAATFALTILLLSSLLQYVCSPFTSSSLNRLELLTLLSAAFILFCGVIFKGDVLTNGGGVGGLSPEVTLFVTFIFVAVGVTMAVVAWVYWRKVEKVLFCRRCRRVPALRVKSAALMNKVGRRLRERVKQRRDVMAVPRRHHGGETREALMGRCAAKAPEAKEEEGRREEKQQPMGVVGSLRMPSAAAVAALAMARSEEGGIVSPVSELSVASSAGDVELMDVREEFTIKKPEAKDRHDAAQRVELGEAMEIKEEMGDDDDEEDGIDDDDGDGSDGASDGTSSESSSTFKVTGAGRLSG